MNFSSIKNVSAIYLYLISVRNQKTLHNSKEIFFLHIQNYPLKSSISVISSSSFFIIRP